MKTLLIALTSLSSAAIANPVATAVVEKTWERCLISVGEKSSTVNAPFLVFVPVIISESMATDLTKVERAVNARLEVEGSVYEPVNIKLETDPLLPGPPPDPLLPAGTVKVECCFMVGKLPSKSFSVVVSYEQPTIDGKVYYLPQFEEGKNPKDYAEFSVSIFPTIGGLLTLESKHKQEVTSFATRVTVKPVHNEIIKIGYNRSESGPRD
jgi:hypothetical protein